MTSTAQAAKTPLPTTQRRERRLARLGATAAAVTAAVVVWGLAEVMFAFDLQAPSFDGSGRAFDIGPGQVVFTAGLASLAGWGLLALLERTARARVSWAVVATVTLLVSLGGPLSGSGVTAGNRAVLVVLHIAVGAVLIPMLYRTSAQRPAGGNRHARGQDRS